MRQDTPPVEEQLRPFGLNTSQAAVYTALLRLRLARSPEVAAAVDQPEERVEPDLQALTRLGVVDSHDGRYLARHPAAALSPLIARRLEKIAQETRQIEELLSSVRTLAQDYDAGQDLRSGRLTIETHSGPEALRATMAAAAGETSSPELIAVVPDRRTVRDLACAYGDEWVLTQREGLVSSRVIMPVGAPAVPGARELFARLAEAGARVRFLDRPPGWYAVMGDETSWLPVRWGGNLPDCAYHFRLVRSPLMVAVLRALFEELWTRAAPMSPPSGREGVVTVLRLAAQGLPDEVIARHLGVCVRTVRSRFAEAMAELGVRSRFQAGVEAVRQGWLDGGAAVTGARRPASRP
ncbi:helix-turn-helix transcriptional regulator [Thermopolyspora flexuosa]|uniref:Regulatory LuxR family protein n=1 Tax=Thermopolyspora flexuosa TaxID=103836 RepID=A0A543J2G7_9ACTN|nr:LuxR family transcriptional regulator [Thermopolyspora flexuosa]TQM77025.1 regulatory LuxR family protein [Thermopolyspora flexuosa]